MGIAGLELLDYFLVDREPVAYNQLPYGNCSERTIEIPIALRFLKEQKAGLGEPYLEIGNVLANYEALLKQDAALANRIVLDKFEEAPGVLNVDLMEYDGKHSLILCLSTVEHVGQHAYGEQKSGDREAPLRAIRQIYNLLAPGGTALVTVPFGKLMDMGWLIQFSDAYLQLLTDKYGVPREAAAISYFRKQDMDMHLQTPPQCWIQCEKGELTETMFDSPFMFANGIAVIRLRKIGPDIAPELPEASPLVYMPAPLISSVYFSPFIRPAGFDKDGCFPANRPGYPFYSHPLTLAPGSYVLKRSFDIEGSGEFTLEMISEHGRRLLWSERITGSGDAVHRIVLNQEERDASLRLYQHNSARSRLKVPCLLFMRDS